MSETLWERVERFWTWMRSGRAERPTDLIIPSANVAPADAAARDLLKDRSYFEVVVKEMYLAFDREWFKVYQPVVLVSSTFLYDRGMKEVPFVVGPSQLGKSIEAPRGLLIKNTRVAGPYPYRGDRLTLSVVLGKVKQTDYAKGLLELIAGVAGVIPAATALDAHLKVAGSVLDGVETLLKMGDQESLVGLRKELAPTAGPAGTAPSIRPSYFALINQPEGTYKPEELFVKDGGLARGASLAEARPFRDADYVLYTVQGTASREDERSLPFFDLWNQALAAAGRPDAESWKLAKTSLAALYIAMVASSDLVRDQVATMIEAFKKELDDVHKTASVLESLGPILAANSQLKAVESILALGPSSGDNPLFKGLRQVLVKGGDFEELGPGQLDVARTRDQVASRVQETARMVNMILESSSAAVQGNRA